MECEEGLGLWSSTRGVCMLREREFENLEGVAKNWMPLKEDNNLTFSTPLISVYLAFVFRSMRHFLHFVRFA